MYNLSHRLSVAQKPESQVFKKMVATAVALSSIRPNPTPYKTTSLLGKDIFHI